MKNIVSLTNFPTTVSTATPVTRSEQITNTTNTGPVNRIGKIQDMVSLNQPNTTVTYQNNRNLTPEITIVLPDDNSYLNLQKMKYLLGDNPIVDTTEFSSIIYFHDNLDEISELLKWCKTNNNEELFKNSIGNILSHHPRGKILECNYLTKYLGLKILEDGKAKYKLGEKYSICNYKKSPHINNPIHLLLANRLDNKMFLAKIAFKNNNIKMVDQTFRYILTNSPNSLKLLTNNINERNMVIHDFYSVVDLIKPEYQNQFYTKYQDYFIQYPVVIDAISNILLHNNASDLAVQFLTKGLKNLSEKDGVHFGYSLYNMGVALSKEGKFIESFNYHDKAYQQLPDDSDALKELITAATKINKHNEINQILKNLPDNSLKKLLTASRNLNNLNTNDSKEIQNIKDSEIPQEFHDILYSMRFAAAEIEKLKNEAINSQQFSINIKLLQTQNVKPEPLLSLCVFFKQEKCARDIINNIEEDIINNNYVLQSFKSLLQSGNTNNGNLVQEIANYNVTAPQKAELHLAAASRYLTENNFKQAEEHLQEAQNIEPDSENIKSLNLLSSIVSSDTKKIQQNIESSDKESLEERLYPFLNDESDINSINTDNILKIVDQKKIHAHFQMIKQQKLNHLPRLSSQNIGWQINENHIPDEQVTSLGNYQGLEYYGYIDPKLAIKEHYNAFSNALNKGFAQRSKGQNGIKFLQKNAIELKIDGDLRLFTNIIHKNKNEQLLIMFDHSGNHESVKTFVSKNKINYLDLS